MNSGFINRLVGTTIVVIAAIVFIPNILDGEKVHYAGDFKAIPERPEFATIDLQNEIDNKVASAEQPKQPQTEAISADDSKLEPETTSHIESIDEPKMVAASTSDQVTQPQIPARKPDENLTQMAYVIQLGSFSHTPNVKSLQAKLKAKGFKTFTRPVKTPNGTLTKVFVGPSLDKQALQSQLPELKALTKLNGKVTQFEITK
ncbi:SPOR domain-containing protein [Pseudoalteromonas mariniglutinosa]|uniref:SPOR domain-containing protein n=1 Tax=Pseudoalteromonas mariniglutinosa TaxID=206042 RepID=UPI0038502FEE